MYVCVCVRARARDSSFGQNNFTLRNIFMISCILRVHGVHASLLNHLYVHVQGDWIIMGTDGLFDNLSDDEIAEQVMAVFVETDARGETSRTAAGKVM